VVVAVGEPAIGLATLELVPAVVIGTPVIERAQALRSNETDRRPETNLWNEKWCIYHPSWVYSSG
jgi:Na+/glutamate symporter